MDTRSDRRDDVTIFTVTGKVDATTADLFAERLAGLVEGGEARIVVDCGELSYISSAGLRAILATEKSAQAAGGRLALAALQPDVRRVLEISGFPQLVAMHDDVDGAAAALGADA